MTSPVKIDKVAILAGILRRNALRREAQLPLLDVWVFYRKEAAYQRAWARHDAYYQALRAEVIERLETERGPDFIRTRLGTWIVHTEALRLLRDRFPTEQRHTTST